MKALISQFSPFSCALDCWTHYMRECGNHIVTEEILRHHRDICWNANQPHSYGAIDSQRFKTLASRYKKQAFDFTPKSEKEVEEEIQKGRGIFIFATNYNGNAHAMRAVGVVGAEIEILVPGLPYGQRENASLDQIVNVWKGLFVEVE